MSKKLLNLIPSNVRIKSDVTYEVVWIEHFKDRNQLGECRPDNRQIVIGKDQSPTEAYKTFIHEVIHAVSLESDGMNLTERQVALLEEELFRVLKLNKIINLLLKNS